MTRILRALLRRDRPPRCPHCRKPVLPYQPTIAGTYHRWCLVGDREPVQRRMERK